MPASPSPTLVLPSFKPLRDGDGAVGPYGEVQVFKVGSEWLPVRVATRDRSALMDFRGRSPFVSYGTGSAAITLSSQGIQFANGRPLSWSGETIKKLLNTLATNIKLAQSAMLLRSTLHTAYPAAVALQQKPLPGKRMSSLVKKTSSGLGQRSMFCTVDETTETVTRRVTELVERIQTADEQYAACFNRQAVRPPCSDAGLLAGPCAAAACAIQEFIDIVTSFVEVVIVITEEVVRRVVVCDFKLEGWPNPWATVPPGLLAGVAQPKAKFSDKEIKDAIKLVKSFANFLGPFGTCLINGRWNLAQLDTPLDLGDGPLALPYGVKVCIQAECAKKLTIEKMGEETLNSWGSALAALAALSPTFAAATGIAPAAFVVGIAALPPAVVAAASLILAFIILALIYGTLISIQLSIHQLAGSFSDGVVCIEHPTFALALIKLASLTLVPAELVPPIVTG